MAQITPAALATKLLDIIRDDEDRLGDIDRYIQGDHDLPYMPSTADAEYKMLAKRAISNWAPLLIGTIAQALYVDGYRPGESANKSRSVRRGASATSPQWDFWQRSRLDGRQSALYRDSCGFGQAFILTYKNSRGQAIARALSPKRTAAVFRDPANDEAPYAVLHIDDYPSSSGNSNVPGHATMWDGTHEFAVTFGSDKVRTKKVGPHGAKSCPVTRFAPYVDLEGRTTGLVEPMMPLQDRINQTIFDLLIAQTYSSFKVRWVTGMAPPFEYELRENADGELERVIKTDPVTGDPIPKQIDHNAKRFLFADDPDVKFGSLDESPLAGYIDSVDMSIRHLSAIAQIPPHHLLGQIANLSAEALQAAETSLSRKVEEFRKAFGESWERVFRLASEMEDIDGAEDYHAEVIWRDVEVRSLSQTADGLGKFAESLDVPKRGLWPRVPGVTQTEIDEWQEMYEEDTAALRAQATLVQSAASNARPASRKAGVNAEVV